MTETSGWGLLTEQIIGLVKEEVDARRSDATGDSEIERLLHHSIVTASSFGMRQYSHLIEAKDGDELPKKPGEIILYYQRQVSLHWRVDFLFHCWDHGYKGRKPEWKRLIVECDGHDFHERNKLQAARDRSRDRWAAQNGFTIFRFTGSEIWKDPLGCAFQVFDWADGCFP